MTSRRIFHDGQQRLGSGAASAGSAATNPAIRPSSLRIPPKSSSTERTTPVPGLRHRARRKTRGGPCSLRSNRCCRRRNFPDAARAGHKGGSRRALLAGARSGSSAGRRCDKDRSEPLWEAVTPAAIGVGQFIGGGSRLERDIFKRAVPFFFGEEVDAVGDDEFHVAGTCLIDAEKIDFVENPVTERAPDLSYAGSGRCPRRTWRSTSSGEECPAIPGRSGQRIQS
jgi:hypothetical protein